MLTCHVNKQFLETTKALKSVINGTKESKIILDYQFGDLKLYYIHDAIIFAAGIPVSSSDNHVDAPLELDSRMVFKMLEGTQLMTWDSKSIRLDRILLEQLPEISDETKERLKAIKDEASREKTVAFIQHFHPEFLDAIVASTHKDVASATHNTQHVMLDCSQEGMVRFVSLNKHVMNVVDIECAHSRTAPELKVLIPVSACKILKNIKGPLAISRSEHDVRFQTELWSFSVPCIPCGSFLPVEKVINEAINRRRFHPCNYSLDVSDLKASIKLFTKLQTENDWEPLVDLFVTNDKATIEVPSLNSRPSVEVKVSGEGAPVHMKFLLKHLATLVNSACGKTLTLLSQPGESGDTLLFTSGDNKYWTIQHHIASCK